MKRPIALILSLIMVVSLCACGEKKPNNVPTESTESMESMESTELEETETSIDEADAYNEAEILESGKHYAEAAIAFGKIADYKDARERSFANWDKVVKYNTIDTAEKHTVAVKNDGTVVAVGDGSWGNCDVSEWTDIVSVAAGFSHTVGLKSDHTVVAVGREPACQVSDWKDIVAIEAGPAITFGIKLDGTVVYCDPDDYLKEFSSIDECLSNIVEVSVARVTSGNVAIAFRRPNGNVLVYSTKDLYGQCKVGTWPSMERVAAGSVGTVGIDRTGKLRVAGFELRDEVVNTIFKNSLQTDEWKGLVDIAVGFTHVVGLKTDGTLTGLDYAEIEYELGRSTNNQYTGEADVSNWKDIVAIAAADKHTIALKSDGTVLATGRNSNGECDVSSWSDIRIPASYSENK